jgi:hypothetical protein
MEQRVSELEEENACLRQELNLRPPLRPPSHPTHVGTHGSLGTGRPPILYSNQHTLAL